MSPRAKNGERERQKTETDRKREREKEKAIRREREKAREKEMCNINIFSVLLCSFLILLFNFPCLSHLLERGKLWNENLCKYLSITRYIEKAEKRLREKETVIRREREKAREGEKSRINTFSVLLCSFLIFLFNLLYLSHRNKMSGIPTKNHGKNP